MTATQTITKGQLKEKYYRIGLDFTNKAGKMRGLLEANKRLIQTLSKERHTDKVKSLIVSSAALYDVSEDMLEYIYELLRDVARDSAVLAEGADQRQIIKDQAETISDMFASEAYIKHMEEARELVKKLKERANGIV